MPVTSADRWARRSGNCSSTAGTAMQSHGRRSARSSTGSASCRPRRPGPAQVRLISALRRKRRSGWRCGAVFIRSHGVLGVPFSTGARPVLRRPRGRALVCSVALPHEGPGDVEGRPPGQVRSPAHSARPPAPEASVGHRRSERTQHDGMSRPARSGLRLPMGCFVRGWIRCGGYSEYSHWVL
jgi:hypothetical protein